MEDWIYSGKRKSIRRLNRAIELDDIVRKKTYCKRRTRDKGVSGGEIKRKMC